MADIDRLPEGGVPFFGAFGTAFAVLKREIITAIVLVVVYGGVSITLMTRFTSKVIESAQAGTTPEFSAASFFAMYFVILGVGLLSIVIWCRTSALGSAEAFAGGIGALARRLLWSAWRFIGLIGWMLVAMIPFLVIMFLATLIVTALTAASGANGDPQAAIPAMLLVMGPVYLGLIYVSLVLMGLWSTSLHAEAQDFHLPIHKSYKLLGKRAWKLGASFLILELVMIVIYLASFGWPMMEAMMSGDLAAIEDPSAIMDGYGWMMGVMTVLGTVVYFLMINLAGIYADLIPLDGRAGRKDA